MVNPAEVRFTVSERRKLPKCLHRVYNVGASWLFRPLLGLDFYGAR
jgi:hypothetical protein